VDEKDKTIKTRLAQPDHQAAILTWAVRGAVKFYERGGLAEPFTISQDTESQRANNDHVGLWMEQALEITGNPDDRIATAHAFSSWKDWCREENHEAQERNQAWLNKVNEKKLKTQGGGKKRGQRIPTMAKTTTVFFGVKWQEDNDPTFGGRAV